MNLLLLYAEEHQGGDLFRVEGPRADHLYRVLRVKPGQSLHAGLLMGPRGRAEVRELRPPAVWLRFEAREQPEVALSLRVLLAIPRPKVLRRLLPQLAALGVEELVLVRTWRVARSYLESEVLRPENFRPYLHRGLMQACLTHEPRVRIERAFKPYVQDRLAHERPGEVRIVAHPRARSDLREHPTPRASGGAVFIGPEGGLLDEEVALLEEASCLPVRLGPGILAVETACISAVAHLQGWLFNAGRVEEKPSGQG